MRGAVELGEVHGGHALLLIISILQSAPPGPASAVLLAKFRRDRSNSGGSSGGDLGGDFRKQRAPARVT